MLEDLASDVGENNDNKSNRDHGVLGGGSGGVYRFSIKGKKIIGVRIND